VAATWGIIVPFSVGEPNAIAAASNTSVAMTVPPVARMEISLASTPSRCAPSRIASPIFSVLFHIVS